MNWRELLAKALVKYGPVLAEAIFNAVANKVEKK